MGQIVSVVADDPLSVVDPHIQTATNIINRVAEVAGNLGVRKGCWKTLDPNSPQYPPNFYDSNGVNGEVAASCAKLVTDFKAKNVVKDKQKHPQDQSEWAAVSAWVMYFFCAQAGEARTYQELAEIRNSARYRSDHYTAILLDSNSELVPGDLISYRILLRFKHVGIYLGKYNGVHFVADLDVNSRARERSCTRVKTLEEFVSGADDKKSLRIRVWKNETKINSIPALMLICQALMGLSFEYQLFNGNCENFANFVYSGLDVCSQTKLFGKLHKGRVGSFKGAVGTVHEFYAEKYDPQT